MHTVGKAWTRQQEDARLGEADLGNLFWTNFGKGRNCLHIHTIPNCGNGSGYLGLGLYKSDASRTLGDHHQQGDQKKKGELDTAGTTCGGEYNLYLFLLPLFSYF